MFKGHKRIGFGCITALFVLFIFSCNTTEETLRPQFITLYQAGEQFSFRGLHAVDDSVVVVGGSEGSFCFSLDAGIHWEFMQIPDAP